MSSQRGKTPRKQTRPQFVCLAVVFVVVTAISLIPRNSGAGQPSNWSLIRQTSWSGGNAERLLEDRGTAALPELILALGKKDSRIEECYAQIHMRLPDVIGRALPSPAQPLLMRVVASDCVGKLGAAGAPAVSALHDLLRSNNRYDRLMACTALGQIGPAAGVARPQLHKMLYVPDAALQLEAAGALLRIGPPNQEAREILEKALTSGNQEFRLHAASLMPKDELATLAILPVVTATLGNTNQSGLKPIAVDIVAGLDRSGQRAAVPALALALRRYHWVREPICRIITNLGPEAAEAVPALIACLEQPDDGSRNLQLKALAAIGPAAHQAIPMILKLVHDKDVDPETAASRLRQMGAPGPVELPAVLKAAEDENEGVRLLALECLEQAQMEPRIGWAVFSKARNESDPRMQQIAERAIRRLIDRDAADALAQMSLSAGESPVEDPRQ